MPCCGGKPMVRLVSSQGALAVRAHRDDPWDQMQQVLGAKQQGHVQRRGEEDRRARAAASLSQQQRGKEKKKRYGRWEVWQIFGWGGIAKKYLFSLRAARGNGRGAPFCSFAGVFGRDS